MMWMSAIVLVVLFHPRPEVLFNIVEFTAAIYEHNLFIQGKDEECKVMQRIAEQKYPCCSYNQLFCCFLLSMGI